MYYKKNNYEKAFDACNSIFLLMLSVICLYPMLHILFASFSDPLKLLQNGTHILLKPLGFSMEGYKALSRNPNMASGYLNTIFYVAAGTTLNVLMTCLGAYMLSRKKMMWKKPILLGIIFTMYFSGGMIPQFLLVRNLGLYDTRLAVLLPSAVATMNLLILRTAFQTIPEGMEESARIDGANDFVILFKILIPVARATVAVIVLFYAVKRWNDWFEAMIYLKSRNLFPLQLILREILIENSAASISAGADISQTDTFLLQYILKYAAIIVSTVPILFIYPFLQRFFVSGIMIGSLKE